MVLGFRVVHLCDPRQAILHLADDVVAAAVEERLVARADGVHLREINVHAPITTRHVYLATYFVYKSSGKRGTFTPSQVTGVYSHRKQRRGGGSSRYIYRRPTGLGLGLGF